MTRWFASSWQGFRAIDEAGIVLDDTADELCISPRETKPILSHRASAVALDECILLELPAWERPILEQRLGEIEGVKAAMA